MSKMGLKIESISIHIFLNSLKDLYYLKFIFQLLGILMETWPKLVKVSDKNRLNLTIIFLIRKFCSHVSLIFDHLYVLHSFYKKFEKGQIG